MSTRFIPREEVASVARWQFGAIGADAVEEGGVAPPPAPPAAAAPALDIEALLQTAREEAYATGLAEGRRQGEATGAEQLSDYQSGEAQAAAERLAQVFAQVSDGAAQMQQAMAANLLEMACQIARQVLRRELAHDTQALLPVVQEAVGLLAADSQRATVHLHPQDLQALAPALQTAFPDQTVQWQADAALAPGDCRVQAAGAAVDGRLDTRWRRAVAALGLESGWGAGDDAEEATAGDAEPPAPEPAHAG